MQKLSSNKKNKSKHLLLKIGYNSLDDINFAKSTNELNTK